MINNWRDIMNAKKCKAIRKAVRMRGFDEREAVYPPHKAPRIEKLHGFPVYIPGGTRVLFQGCGRHAYHHLKNKVAAGAV